MADAIRAAKNEDLFREVNERIRDLGKSSTLLGYAPFICECSRPDCHHGVEATIEEYLEVRAEATHFLVVPGHTDPALERIIRTNERFMIVEKFGLAGEIAEAEAP
ncbi:MAG: hypothetical protein M3O89_00430 [Actinomycetota bacterium]|nr:hypothetical protein [Actinomycetota bacterium]